MLSNATIKKQETKKDMQDYIGENEACDLLLLLKWSIKKWDEMFKQELKKFKID